MSVSGRSWADCRKLVWGRRVGWLLLRMTVGTSRRSISGPVHSLGPGMCSPAPPPPPRPHTLPPPYEQALEHILSFRTSQQGEQGEVSAWSPSLPPRASCTLLHPCPEVRTTHLALSLKEIREIPGGAFRTFWEPEYKMSMPRMDKGVSEIPQELIK